MYGRAMVDLEAMLHNHSSKDEGFNEMSKLNTYMLSFLYPKQYKDFTYNIDNDTNISIIQQYKNDPKNNKLEIEN